MLQRLQSLEGRGAGAISVERSMQEFSLRLQALEERVAQANAAPGAVAAPAEEVASEEPPPTVLAPAEPDSREAGLSSGPWTPSAPTPSTAAAPARLETLEGQIGGRWSVLVGGLALALGAIFLVRYSIEQGLVGPRMRIALGALLAAVLLAGGELLRRRDRKRDIPALAKADVPAVLTGAGALAAFTTIYAAYALYRFL